jgi:hypothetical protein
MLLFSGDACQDPARQNVLLRLPSELERTTRHDPLRATESARRTACIECLRRDGPYCGSKCLADGGSQSASSGLGFTSVQLDPSGGVHTKRTKIQGQTFGSFTRTNFRDWPTEVALWPTNINVLKFIGQVESRVPLGVNMARKKHPER